ncbi:DUF2939 domain-containing protein [Brevundimonas sp. FT23028]|uniref:DUF2939 domain-containing protein n=1 Tax=Brevundimonas sp. FT23028 TaxID=3393748 RepID=UPI003B586E39
MTKKLLTGALLAAVVLLAAAWGLAPVLTGQALIRAARAGDAQKLEQLVDFPALRQSLKDELQQELVRRVGDDPRLAERGLGALGMMLAPMILEGAVDAVVTPEVLARMVNTAEAPDPTRPAPPEPGDAKDGRDIHQAWGYRDLNHFAVTLTDRDHPDQHLALILERRGLFRWQLAAIDLQSDGA